MVLTDRQRNDLHAGIFEYLQSRPGEAFQRAAAALAEADPDACEKHLRNGATAPKTTTPLLEKKWTAIPRLQKKVLELERQAAQSATIHAHRLNSSTSSMNGAGVGGKGGAVSERRMLPRLPCQHSLPGHSAVVTTVALHPIFTIVASGSEDGTIKIWDHESGDYIRTLKGHTNTVNSVSFAPKGTHLASCSADLSIKLWDFTTFACLRTLRGHDHTISSVRFLPSLELAEAGENANTNGSVGGNSTTPTGVTATAAGCQHLLSASRDTTVKMWDIETGFCDHTFTHHTDWVRCLAVRQSDGGLWASAGNDQTIYVTDPATKNVVVELRGHEHVINSLAFVTEPPLQQHKENLSSTNNSPRSTMQHQETVRDYLASGSRDRTVRLWKISQAACIAVFKSHENWVQSVVIHPTGNYILSCADDKSIRVFDIAAQRCLRTLEKAHNHFITTIDMHHTLPVLVSGSVDQTLRCWQLD